MHVKKQCNYIIQKLISVDLYGQSCDYDAIEKLCEKYNVLLIEDAAEALGADFKGTKCSSFGELGILSFNGKQNYNYLWWWDAGFE